MDPLRPEETWTPSISAATDPHLPDWSSFLWHIRYHPTLLTWHIDVKGALAAKRHLAVAYWASSRVRETKYETRKKKRNSLIDSFSDTNNTKKHNSGSISQPVCEYQQQVALAHQPSCANPGTELTRSPASVCYDDTQWMKTWAATLDAVRNDISPPHPACADVQRLTLKWAIHTTPTTQKHTHTYAHTHTSTTTTNPIMLSPSPIPLRNERGLCQSNSIVWVEVMNSSLLSIHLRLIVFLFVPVICRW